MRSLKDRRGSVTVEFGFVALAFFLLIFAIIDLSRVYFMLHDLAAAVREGARYGVVLQDPVGRADDIRDVVKQYALTFGGQPVTDAQIEITMDADERLTVTIRDYPFEFIVLPFGTINVTRQAVLRWERAQVS